MGIDLSYHFDWRGLERFNYKIDPCGLPQVDYGPELGLRHNAITIAQYGLYHLQCYDRFHREKDKIAAFTCANWLVENVREWHNNSLAWVYDYDMNFYGLKAPWISAMAQGEAVSLLLRCYIIKAYDDFEDICMGAIKTLDFSVEEGGTVDELSDGSTFFEEYPTEPASHVLNGHIFALLGAYDFALHFDQPVDWQRVERGLQTITTNWHMWDVSFWTLYDLHPSRRLASRTYQKLHIRQMKMLYRLFKDKVFRDVVKRWQKMWTSPVCHIRWALGKIDEKRRLHQEMA